MLLCKCALPTGESSAGVITDNEVQLLGGTTLSEVLHADNPTAAIQSALTEKRVKRSDVILLPPMDAQEVWAAGVTYKRSQQARERESADAGRFYDLVYSAARPELFFKATPRRVVSPGGTVRVRRDSQWSVPEPELALVISPQLRLVGFTLGNDMSARDIEGENPLYLPQAKVYQNSCSLGPAIVLHDQLPPLDQVEIRLSIDRQDKVVFAGATKLSMMARSFADLIDWLGRDNSFPDGVVLMTGTGIVPPDDFTLVHGDLVTIEATGIGKLVNPVEKL